MKTPTWTQLAALLLGAAVLAAPASAAGDKEFAATVSAIHAAAVAQAEPTVVESVVRDQTTTLAIDLNKHRVKWSTDGYSVPTLKILVPQLAEITLLDHRNEGEDAPCIATGSMRDILKPGEESVENIPVQVVLRKVATRDGNACRVSLEESVQAVIRGANFTHFRSHDLPGRVGADCR